MSENFDLFGHPVIEGRRTRGRPKHEVTVENRNRVSMLLAFGWTDERIANALGISKPTLYKHYFNEMKRRLIARDMLEAVRLSKLWELGMDGNSAAFKEFGRLLDKSDAANAERSFRGDDDEDDTSQKQSKLGKKELAQIEAEAAEQSDSWGSDLLFRGRGQLN